jgi:hypothetical protein
MPSHPDWANGCAIKLEFCFGSGFLSGEEADPERMFKDLTFERWACGDCGEWMLSAQ